MERIRNEGGGRASGREREGGEERETGWEWFPTVGAFPGSPESGVGESWSPGGRNSRGGRGKWAGPKRKGGIDLT